MSQRGEQTHVLVRQIRLRGGLCVAVAVLTALLAMALVQPVRAWAADYRCAQVDLVAQVETSGTVTIVDQRVFEFADEEGAYPTDDAALEDAQEKDAGEKTADGDKAESPVGQGDTPADNAAATSLASTAPQRQTLKWLYDGFDEDAEITIKRVRMAAADAEGNVVGKWRKLKSTTFVLSWRGGGGPETEAWSFDKYRSTLYAFIENTEPRVVFEVTYTVKHAVVAFDDAADFSWGYAPRDYPVDLHNVSAEVILPVPADDKVVPSDNVRAWGHGPANGTVDIEKDGTVTFADPEVPSASYALGRVMFPVEWLANMPDEERYAHQGSLQYEYTTRYEEGWVDSNSYQKMTRDGLAGALLALAALALLGGVLAFLRWGRQRPPQFTADESRDIPDPSLPPAVMGRLWRWNHVSSDDVVATLADMALRGVVALRADDSEEAAVVFEPWREPLRTEEESEEANLQEADDVEEHAPATPEAALTLAHRDAMDEATLRLLTYVAQGGNRLTAEQLDHFAQKSPGAFLRAVDGWQQVLTAQVEPYRFLDLLSRRAQRVMLVGAGVLALAGLVALFALNVPTGLLSLAAAVALGVLANYTMRRSPTGNEITAHAKALRNWMAAGGAYEEGLTSAEVDELVPYGLLFGVLGDLPATPLGAFVGQCSELSEEALRRSSRRAEVSGSSGDAPADKAVEPHWRPFWRRPAAPREEPIDDDF